MHRLERELDEPEIAGESVPDGLVAYDMPVVAWDRRYFRQSFTFGVEVAAVRRVQGQRWLVLKPDLSFGVLALSMRTTVCAQPQAGVHRRRCQS